jgi:hypothetical protein
VPDFLFELAHSRTRSARTAAVNRNCLINNSSLGVRKIDSAKGGHELEYEVPLYEHFVSLSGQRLSSQEMHSWAAEVTTNLPP